MRDALVYAVGAALSPVPIAGSLVLLTTRNAIPNGLSFAAGWTLGVAAVASSFVALTHVLGLRSSGSAVFATADLLLGSAFVLVAIVVWRRRSNHADDRRAPWLDRVHEITPSRSAGAGAVLSGLNPKVAALSLGAALALAEADATAAVDLETVVLYTLIAALGVLVPFAVYAAAPARAASTLRGFRAWLEQNEALTLAVVGLLVGGVFLASGVRGL